MKLGKKIEVGMGYTTRPYFKKNKQNQSNKQRTKTRKV